jgi:hypothetical protein
MSALPPNASNAPQPADNEPDDTAVPRWAVPAVPPPWAGAGQAAPAAPPPPVAPPQAHAPAAQPGWGQPGFAPAVAGKPLFDRRKLLSTVAVAGIIAGVVLGGLGLDSVLAAPSAGKLSVGSSVAITAAPGWVRADDGTGSGVVLQKANAQLTVMAQSYGGSASAALRDVEGSISADAAKVSFGEEQDGTLTGHEVAMAGFSAVVSGQSGSGTVDGEVICMVVGGKVVVFEVVTAQGYLDRVVDDIRSMVSSVEVGQ